MRKKEPNKTELKGKSLSEAKRKFSKETERKLLAGALIAALTLSFIAVGALQWGDRRHYIISLSVILSALFFFFLIFEKRRPNAKKAVLIAVMTAAAVAGRAAFFMLPQFKPVAAVVIITGAALGCEAGFITGALSMLISNMFFGQGPWTPWQMFAMGIIGFIAGLVFTKEIKTKAQTVLFCVFGALLTFFIYGFTVDTASFLISGAEFSFGGLLAVLAAGAVFNFIHAVSTFVFLIMLAKPLLNKFKRIKLKYGL